MKVIFKIDIYPSEHYSLDIFSNKLSERLNENNGELLKREIVKIEQIENVPIEDYYMRDGSYNKIAILFDIDISNLLPITYEDVTKAIAGVILSIGDDSGMFKVKKLYPAEILESKNLNT